MSFRDKLDEIDSLQQSIENHGKLGKELLQKINYKFRLDWNYYSNRMEGNTLTLDETKSVMIGNINVHKKPLKDIMEMKGHDEAVMMILKIGKGELNISEKRIKELHKEIMYEEFPGEKEKLGAWKSQANHVINYRGEKFDFVAPPDVAENMHGLVNWVNAEKEKIAANKGPLHPVELAFEFHLRYLTIHPFYDGNGRTGRILTNLILISYGFPPIYVKDSDKQFYYRYLADVQGYSADKYLFFDLMAEYLLRSLNIVADAIGGKEIEEPEDLDKKIQRLQKELSGLHEHDPSKTYYSKAVLLKIFDDWLSKLIVSAVQTAQKFSKFYSTTKQYAIISNSGVAVALNNANLIEEMDFLKDRIEASNDFDTFPRDVELTIYLEGLIGHNFDEPAKLNVSDFIKIRFLENRYQLFVEVFEEKAARMSSVKLYDRLLDEPVTNAEIVEITSLYGNSIFGNIDYKTRIYGLRK